MEPPVGKIALFSLLHDTLGIGKPPAKHSNFTAWPSLTTNDLVELSDIIGGRRTSNSTSADTLLFNPRTT